MVISFDLDSVLAAFQLGWIEFNKQKYHEEYTFEDFTVFDYTQVMHIDSDEAFKRIYEFYETNVGRLRERVGRPSRLNPQYHSRREAKTPRNPRSSNSFRKSKRSLVSRDQGSRNREKHRLQNSGKI